MSNFLAGAVGGVTNVLQGAGAALTLGGKYMSDRETNQTNREIGWDQEKFQERMRNTAHQAEVKDMIKAGLNPNLSTGGSGAPSPSGASPTMVAPQINMPDMLAYGVSLKQLEQADKKIEIDQANSAAAISKTLSETELNKMKKILAQKGMVRSELEGEASQVLRNIIKWMKNTSRKSPTFQKTKDVIHEFNNRPMP